MVCIFFQRMTDGDGDGRFPIIRHNHSATCFYELQLTIPSLITRDYWKRHKLGWNDIQLLVSGLPSQYLWLSCLQYGVHCPWSYIKSSYSNPGEVTISGKKHAVKHIHSKLKLYHADLARTQSMLRPVDGHGYKTPPLPVYSIPYADYHLLLRHLNPNLLPEYLYETTFDIPVISLIYPFLSNEWVVTSTRTDAIHLCRVIPANTTKNFHPTLNNVVSVGYFQNTLYATTDEFIMVYPVESRG